MRNGLQIFWHVYPVNDWREIVKEQLALMETSGLINFPIRIGVATTPECQEAERMLDDAGEVYFFSEEAFEFPTLCWLYDSKESYDLALYFHTKGVTHPREAKWNRWRRILNHSLLSNWRVHVNALREYPFNVSGQNYLQEERPHFSGNFWMTTSAHVRQLPSPRTLDWKDRHAAESWVCSIFHRPHVLPFIEPSV